MDLVYRIAFSMVKGMTSEIAEAVLGLVGSEERFFRMPEKELEKRLSMSSRVLKDSYRTELLALAEKEAENIGRGGIRAVYFTDSAYPMRFRMAADAPLMLYAKGGADFNANKVVSVVGTRHATSRGLDFCRALVFSLKELVGADTLIVSGLAYGIDVAAHLAALEAGLPTVAIVAHGLDTVYPAPHRSVASDIVRSGGAVATEYVSGTRIHRSNFLARNRLVAAMADCTVVVESAEKGGALVTAGIAQGYGRDVFAVPGRPDDEYSSGCNSLIRKNVASLITGGEDLAEMMGWKRQMPKPVQQELFPVLTADEQKICNCLEKEGLVHINELAQLVNLRIHSLMSMLVDLEFRGVVRSLPGNRYEMA